MAAVIFDMPFDEPNGSPVAYDLGPGGHHAAVSDGTFTPGGHFIPGKFANCVYFPSNGQAEILENFIDFSKDFTFEVWAIAEPRTGGPSQTWATFYFGKSRGNIDIPLYTVLQYWQHIAVTKKGYTVRVFVDGVPKGTMTELEPLLGFAFINNSAHRTGGFCRLDSAKVYDYAFTEIEIDNSIKQKLEPVDIFINNVHLDAYGVTVEKISGILDMPDRKDPLTVDWEDYHGEVIDLVKPLYDVRTITLDCWIKGTTQDDFVAKWQYFKAVFDLPGTQRLTFQTGSKPIFFEVYQKEALEFTTKWRNTAPWFGRFTLKLREPEPVKRVLKVTGNSVTITLTSAKMLSVSWGDGSKVRNVYGTGLTISHTYANSGTYYVIVAGNIEDVTDFTTNAAILWNKI